MVARSSPGEVEANQRGANFNYHDSLNSHLQKLIGECTQGKLAINLLYTTGLQSSRKLTGVCFNSFRQSQGQSCDWFCHRLCCPSTRDIYFAAVQSSVVQSQEQ